MNDSRFEERKNNHMKCINLLQSNNIQHDRIKRKSYVKPEEG
jgi:hypothetical protein